MTKPCWNWLPSAFFLLFAVPTVLSTVVADPIGPRTALLPLSFLAYGFVFVRISLRLWVLSLPQRLLAVAVMFGLATGLVALLGLGSTWMFVYAMGVTAMALPLWLSALVGVPVLAAIGMVLLRYSGSGALSSDWIVLIAVFVTTWFVGKLIRANHDLSAAEGEIGRFAVAEERARLAAELQDRLGAELAAITEKSAVTCAELVRTGDRAAAVGYVREVEELARHAVTEVRATVSGYRTASLAAELVGAKAALAAAGITAKLPAVVDTVDPRYREAFAHVLRDGVTAVLRRDCGATRCEVRLGKSWLEVRDDGAASVSGVNSQVADLITGLGGRIEAGPTTGGGFLLRVAVLL